jgi:hypothetical protein
MAGGPAPQVPARTVVTVSANVEGELLRASVTMEGEGR